MTGEPTRRQHATAALVLAAFTWFALLMPPVLDTLPPFKGADKRAEYREDVGWLYGSLIIALADVDSHLRDPLVEGLGLDQVQPVFRIAQTWRLFTGGPRTLRRLEIFVDGELKYRSVDPRYRWLEPQLRYRKIRPVVDTTTAKVTSRNHEGLARLVVRRARQRWPEAQRVELRATRRPFGDPDAVELQHSVVAAAPDWDPEVQE